jgi:hypothetical protein
MTPDYLTNSYTLFRLENITGPQSLKIAKE